MRIKSYFAAIRRRGHGQSPPRTRTGSHADELQKTELELRSLGAYEVFSQYLRKPRRRWRLTLQPPEISRPKIKPPPFGHGVFWAQRRSLAPRQTLPVN